MAPTGHLKKASGGQANRCHCVRHVGQGLRLTQSRFTCAIDVTSIGVATKSAARPGWMQIIAATASAHVLPSSALLWTGAVGNAVSTWPCTKKSDRLNCGAAVRMVGAIAGNRLNTASPCKSIGTPTRLACAMIATLKRCGNNPGME